MPDRLYYYQNFTIPAGFDSLDVLVWGTFAGVMLGATAATLDKLYCKRMVTALVQAEAQTPEKAMTLASMNIKGKWYLRHALKAGKPLRKMLTIPETIAVDALPKKTEEIPFYLPEERRYQAENRYENGRRPIANLFLLGLALLATVFFVLFAVPELLTMLDNLVGFVKYGE